MPRMLETISKRNKHAGLHDIVLSLVNWVLSTDRLAPENDVFGAIFAAPV